MLGIVMVRKSQKIHKLPPCSTKSRGSTSLISVISKCSLQLCVSKSIESMYEPTKLRT